MKVDDLKSRLKTLAALPPDEARIMPPPYYISADFLGVEEDMLRGEWMCVGHVGEVRGVGDFFTTDLLGEPLIVTRDEAGTVRVLSNVCRHRGGVVAEGSGTARAFTCRYHNWRYGLDGGLKVAPLMNASKALDAARCALPSFPVEIWKGWIFTCVGGEPAPLAGQLGALEDVIRNYHTDERHLVFMTEDRWACNWKSMFENFMEGYHLSATHFDTLHPITPTKLCRKMVTSDAHTGFHAVYDPSYPPRGPFHPDMTEEERGNSPMYGVFPNLLVGMATNFTLFSIIRPDGPGAVKLRWGVLGLEDAPESQPVADYVALCHAFNAEDKEKLEALQASLSTRHFDGGPLAPDEFEGCIRDFMVWMARKLG